MFCNIKHSDGEQMGTKFGKMTGEELEREILRTRMTHKCHYSQTPEVQFLRSVEASCSHLPHTNEAAMNA